MAYGEGSGATASVRVLCSPANWQTQTLLGQPHPQGYTAAPWFCATAIPVEDKTCTAGNPVSPGTGAKVETAVDYTGAGAYPLSFERKYNSLASTTPESPTSGWSHNYAKRVIAYSMPNTAMAGTNIDLALVTSSMDKRRTFRKQTNGTWAPDTGQRDALTELKDANGVRTGWQHKRFEDDALENYNADGVLLSIKERNGWVTTLTYSDAATPAAIAPKLGLLISVKNYFGRELKFTYDAQGRMKELLPPGAVSGSGAGLAQSPIVYKYEEAASLGSGVVAKGQLTSVTWQDGSVKRYHYENTSFPNHLTGITDEAGVRIGTYAYNGTGQAISSEKAGGADKLTFSYSSGRTAVTDYSGPSGSAVTRTYNIQVSGGVARPTSVSAPCPLCGTTQQSTIYGDGTTANGGAGAKGQPIKTVAHDGTVTFYTYDTKGRETEKATFPASYATSATRPALNLATQVISTQWHATYNLPTKIAEPGKITAFTYANANATTGMGAGNLTGRSETTTTDATGAAKFTAAQAAGTPIKSTGWSYHTTSNLPTTIVERETAFGATTATETGRWTYVYNAKGEVTSAKDVTRNRTGTATSYDAQGRMLAGTNDVGVPLGYTYSPRGFVKQRSVSGQGINFTQNSIGLTTEVRTPDNQVFTLIYDANHRLSDIKQNGASITVAMLREGTYPDTYLRAKFEQLKELAQIGSDWLLAPAIAQIPAPLPPPVIPAPGQPMPGQPDFDPSGGLITNLPHSSNMDQTRRELDRLIRKCECKPSGGFDKPTLTNSTWVHMWVQGHTGPTWSNKSYFSPISVVNQAFVDEAISRRDRVQDQGDRIVYWANMSNYIGFVRDPNGPNGFSPTKRVRIVVQKDNCDSMYLRRNEIVTMFPD